MYWHKLAAEWLITCEQPSIKCHFQDFSRVVQCCTGFICLHTLSTRSSQFCDHLVSPTCCRGAVACCHIQTMYLNIDVSCMLAGMATCVRSNHNHNNSNNAFQLMMSSVCAAQVLSLQSTCVVVSTSMFMPGVLGCRGWCGSAVCQQVAGCSQGEA